MEIRRQGDAFLLYKEQTPIGTGRLGPGRAVGGDRPRLAAAGLRQLSAQGTAAPGAAAWTPGRRAASPRPCPTAPPGGALAAKFGFLPTGRAAGVRRRLPDLSAVQFCHDFLAARLAPGGCTSTPPAATATTRNSSAVWPDRRGRVLALDIQPAAVDATNARLAAAGLAGYRPGRPPRPRPPGGTGRPRLRRLRAVQFRLAAGGRPPRSIPPPRTAWPPCAPPLAVLRPGGVLAAVLYSGRVIGDGEKQAALALFRALPLTQYTVLECRFANWARYRPPALLRAEKIPPERRPRPLEKEAFIRQYLAGFNPQQLAAATAVEGPGAAAGRAGKRQDHGAGGPPGVHGAVLRASRPNRS